MVKFVQQLEDALRNYQAAEIYFEHAYIAYRLARQHMDEQERLVNDTRNKIDEEAKQVKERLND